MSKWNLIVDVGACMNCQNCVIAYRDEHVGNDFPGYAAQAPALGEAPIRILRRARGSAPMVDVTYLPVLCNHCDDAPCQAVGGEAVVKRDDGIVLIDPVKAKGRRDIVEACPYGAVVWNEEQNLPQTWIFDAHLLDTGWKEPRCAQACPTDVFQAVKLADADMAAKARTEGLEPLRSDLNTKPRVWYRGLARWRTDFVGGSVSLEKGGVVDCLEGALVILSADGMEIGRAETDAFGDFRFDGLKADGRQLEIEVRHEADVARRSFSLDGSLYLGELRLEKTA
jgi:Fe-S-cluster-containing dehydrogenase component